MRRTQKLGIVLGGLAALLLCVPPASAMDGCRATSRLKDGTVLVWAKNVTGTLKWGWTATTQIQPVFDPTCVKASGTARACTLGAAGTLLATTPPPDCTLQLKDDSGTCTAYVKKCTPGKRPVVQFPIRFVDNGDGTVTDTSTGLMWEQKTTDASIHDTSNTYSWSTASPYDPDGTVFFTFLATLDGPTPFAGYGDWRLPTLTELQTIVDDTQGQCAGGFGPCIDETAFGPTQTGPYWSATTDIGVPGQAATVDFSFGLHMGLLKTGAIGYVRAVRGGS